MLDKFASQLKCKLAFDKKRKKKSKINLKIIKIDIQMFRDVDLLNLFLI
jgi:hypothetical protein